MSRRSTRARNTKPPVYNGDGTDGDFEARLFQHNKDNCSKKKFNNDLKKDIPESDDDDDDADIGADCTKRPASASSKTMRGTSAKRVSRSPQDEDDLIYDDDIDRNDEIGGLALPASAEGDDAAPPVADEGGDGGDGGDDAIDVGGNDAAPPVIDEGGDGGDAIGGNYAAPDEGGDGGDDDADVGGNDAAPDEGGDGGDADGGNYAAPPVIDEGGDVPLAPPRRFTLHPPQPVADMSPLLINCHSIDDDGVVITDDGKKIIINELGHTRCKSSYNYNHQNAVAYSHRGNYNGHDGLPIGDCNANLIAIEGIPAGSDLHRKFGLRDGLFLQLTSSDEHVHSPSCSFFDTDMGASSGTTLYLHVSAVFPNFFNEDGSRNVDLSALMVNEDLLRMLRTRPKNSSVLGQEHILQAEHFIHCFTSGILPDVAEGKLCDSIFLKQYLNPAGVQDERWINSVLYPNHYWDGGHYCKREVDVINGEDSNYERDLYLRVVSNLQFETEKWLKMKHSVEVRGGLLERNREVDIESLDYVDDYMDFSGEVAREVQGIISNIMGIEQERVDSNRDISLLDVATVGQGVDRTIRHGEHFNEIENRIGVTLCVLSYQFKLPPLPDEAVIDWNQSYFGRVYTLLPNKQRNFDALRLFGMMTGREESHHKSLSGVRSWQKRRGMVIRTKMIVQNDVSDDDSIRICLHLMDLAEELSAWVEEQNELSEDTDED